jgi:CheY-like chemotaxis protein
MSAHFEDATIVLVEDDPGHQRLVEINLRRANVTNPLVILQNGQEALRYLFESLSRNPYVAEPMVVLLDLNMPVVDGYQVLQRIKADAQARCIPVIVLTTVDDSQSVVRCYELGCNLFLSKPVDYQQFSKVIQRLGSFLPCVALPSGD